MPNCSEPGCKVRVDDQGMFCRLHQGGDEPDVQVRYMGEGMVQMQFGNFVKGTTARIPKRAADELKGDKDWEILG